MNDDFVHAIGLMSGTSLDGLDLVYVKFKKNDFNFFEILLSKTVAYSEAWRNRLQNAIDLDKEGISILDIDYGTFLGKQTKEFIDQYTIKTINFICSHGHTIFHQPDKGYTLQVGDGNEILKITNCTVVNDFRTQDVHLGGQGAPLVPIGDKFLFSEFEACVNLGGFANISYEQKKQRIAFDVCPVNIVMNYYSKILGLEFDDKGNFARTGTLHKHLLEELNTLHFYATPPPKSLGIEWVQNHIFPLVEKHQLRPNDILRTFTEHVAQQISESIKPYKHILFTGGGVYNDFLLKRIENISKKNITLPSDDIINYKEALIFAFLGFLKLEDQINCLSSVTGAKKNHSSGKIFKANYSN